MTFLDRLFGGGTNRAETEKFGRFLQDQGMLSAEQLGAASRQVVLRGLDLATALHQLGFLDLDSSSKGLGQYHGVPHVTHADFRDISVATVELVPAKLALKHLIVPFRLNENRLDVAMINPLDDAAIKSVFLASDRIINPHVAPAAYVYLALQTHYRLTKVPRHLQAIVDELTRDPAAAVTRRAHSAVAAPERADARARYGAESVPEAETAAPVAEPQPATPAPQAAGPADERPAAPPTEPQPIAAARTLATPEAPAVASPTAPAAPPPTMEPDSPAAPAPAAVAPPSPPEPTPVGQAVAAALRVDPAATGPPPVPAATTPPQDHTAAPAGAVPQEAMDDDLDDELWHTGEYANDGAPANVEGEPFAIPDGLEEHDEGAASSPPGTTGIRQARSRDEIANALLDIAMEQMEVAGLFIMVGDLFIGWSGRGPAFDRPSISNLLVPTDVHTVLQSAAEQPRGFMGVPDDTPANQIFFAEIDRNPQAGCLVYRVYPLETTKSAEIVLYADAGERHIDSVFADRLAAVCLEAGRTLDALVHQEHWNQTSAG